MSGYLKKSLFWYDCTSPNDCVYPQAEVTWTSGTPQPERLLELQNAAKLLEKGCLNKLRRGTHLKRYNTQAEHIRAVVFFQQTIHDNDNKESMYLLFNTDVNRHTHEHDTRLSRRQYNTNQPTTIGLEFCCAIISVIEETIAPMNKLRTIESHGIVVQATSSIQDLEFICVGRVFTTTLSHHTELNANTSFQRNDMLHKDKDKDKDKRKRKRQKDLESEYVEIGHGVGVFGTGLYINSITDNKKKQNCDACSMFVKCGIKQAAEIPIPILYFYAVKAFAAMLFN